MRLRFEPIMLGLLAALAATAATTNELSDKQVQGRQLVEQILQQWPATNVTQTAVLKIRSPEGRRSEIPLKCEVVVTATNWVNRYEAKFGSNATDITTLIVTHSSEGSNSYVLFDDGKTAGIGRGASIHVGMGVSGNRTMIPFANSDFWLADLGLEFFHWPDQKLVKRVVRSSRGCSVLESTNPDPSTNGYSRVVSWIDSESLGILHAEAYDAKGKLLKEYDTKKLKKLKGQWQVEEMEIDNDQTGSRTWLVFDLKRD